MILLGRNYNDRKVNRFWLSGKPLLSLNLEVKIPALGVPEGVPQVRASPWQLASNLRTPVSRKHLDLDIIPGHAHSQTDRQSISFLNVTGQHCTFSFSIGSIHEFWNFVHFWCKIDYSSPKSSTDVILPLGYLWVTSNSPSFKTDYCSDRGSSKIHWFGKKSHS